MAIKPPTYDNNNRQRINPSGQTQQFTLDFDSIGSITYQAGDVIAPGDVAAEIADVVDEPSGCGYITGIAVNSDTGGFDDLIGIRFRAWFFDTPFENADGDALSITTPNNILGYIDLPAFIAISAGNDVFAQAVAARLPFKASSSRTIYIFFQAIDAVPDNITSHFTVRVTVERG